MFLKISKKSLAVCFCLLVFQTFASKGDAQFTDAKEETIKLSAEFQLEKGKRTGQLVLTAKVPEKHYIYSLSQKKVPPPTKIKVSESKQFSVATKNFKPNKKPTVIEHDELFDNRIEKHYGTVVFVAPFSIEEGVNAKEISVAISVTGQVCSDETCTPFRNKKIVAKFGGYYTKTNNKK